jgi:hypothetical protein
MLTSGMGKQKMEDLLFQFVISVLFAVIIFKLMYFGLNRYNSVRVLRHK